MTAKFSFQRKKTPHLISKLNYNSARNYFKIIFLNKYFFKSWIGTGNNFRTRSLIQIMRSNYYCENSTHSVLLR